MLSAETIKQAVLDLKEPIVFSGFQDIDVDQNNPEFLQWNLDKFLEILGNTILPFRTGDNARTSKPQWDMQCPLEHMTISEFIRKSESSNNSKWYYFDYKYMHQWLCDKPEILESINWQRFGFHKTGSDSTLWIGNKGAHTNCHQDSYGCNLIAELHGRKQWLLFPPDSGNRLKPTRVPYEESTVYSKMNFFCPTKDDEEGIMRIKENAKLVVLLPGDVLFVPNGWWHYVESLDLSISINVWLPVHCDYKGRLKEAVVKLLVSNLGQNVPSASNDERPYTYRENIELIDRCIGDYYKNKDLVNNVNVEKRMKKTPWTAQDLAKEYPSAVKLLPELSREALSEFVINKRERFPERHIETKYQKEESEDPPFSQSLESVLNALCHIDVVDKVADLLLDNNL